LIEIVGNVSEERDRKQEPPRSFRQFVSCKHPTPWDFFYSMNDSAGKDLNWFRNNWFFCNGYIDLAMGKVEKGKKAYTVNVKNIGSFFARVDIKIDYEDGSKETLHLTPEVCRRIQTQRSSLF
jgi:hypothetical protein